MTRALDWAPQDGAMTRAFDWAPDAPAPARPDRPDRPAGAEPHLTGQGWTDLAALHEDRDSAAAEALLGALRWWRWSDRGSREPVPPDAARPAPPAETGTPEPQGPGYTGAGQTVVVIDTGYSEAYDSSAISQSYDFAGWNDADASTDGVYSHGSWVAETVLDTATGVEIVHLKVFDDAGQSARLSDIEQALQFTIDFAETTQIAAVNLSLGSGNATSDTWTPLSNEFAALDSLDIVTSVAAGNSGAQYEDGVNVLAANDSVIAVSAVDDTGAFADFSQTSEALTDIAALGVDVEVETAGGQSFEVDGTSFAAPEIAAISALLQEASLDLNDDLLSDEEILEILQASGTAVAGEEDSDAPGYVVADADAALEYFVANAQIYDEGFAV